MDTPKVCLGGFEEGMVLEKRYLLERLYCKTEEAAVWQVCDRLLGISCFALQTLSGDKKRLRILARQIESLGVLSQNPVVLLAIKCIGQTEFLLFSMSRTEQKPDAMEAVLRARSKTAEEEKPCFSHAEPDTEMQKKQALANGTVLGNRYRVMDCIGIGGFGILYLCEDMLLWRLVAVKEYFPAEWAWREEAYVTVKRSQYVEAYRYGMQSFRKEAQLAARFIHNPQIVTVYDILEENDTAYLIMEYISGISIGREMRKRAYRPFTVREMADILFPVMDALQALHGQGIVHSDISPGNIMRSEEGKIFLIDLGAAKYIADRQPGLGAAFLKTDYAAPEQYLTVREGIPRDEGPWTDVYACGATMYYLLTGQKPPDVMQRLNQKKPDIVLPKKCRWKHAKQWMRLINCAMALEIRQRMDSVEKLREEVRSLLDKTGN